MRWKEIIWACLFVLCIGESDGKDLRPEIWEALAAGTPDEVIIKTQTNYLRLLLSDECDSVLIQKSILAYLASTGVWSPEVKSWMLEGWPDRCGIEGANWAFYSGNALYNLAEFGQAIEHYKKADKLFEDIHHKAETIENIAVCFVARQEMEEALRYFEIALSLTPTNHNPLMISNLAGIYNSINAPLQSLETLQLLEGRDLDEPVRRLVGINRIAALKNLADTAALRPELTTFLADYPTPVYTQEIAEVVESMLTLDMPRQFQAYEPLAQPVLDETAEFAEGWMPALMPLLEMGENWDASGFSQLSFESRWHLARELDNSQQKLRASALPIGQTEDLKKRLEESLEREEKTERQLWWVLVGAFSLATISAISIYQRLQVRRLRKAFSKASHMDTRDNLPLFEQSGNAISTIREAITQGKNIQTALVHLSALNNMLNGERHEFSVLDSKKLKNIGLNYSELSLLDHILQGYSAKESSILLDVSTGHIYNMRSNLREKLNLPKSLELREWLFQELQEDC